MVSPFGGFNPMALARRLENVLTRGLETGVPSLSLRQIERITGIAHQRLSELRRAPESISPALAERIGKALASEALQTATVVGRTRRVDAPLFTEQGLANLTPPDVYRGVSIIYEVPESESYRSGVGQTMPVVAAPGDLAAALELVPGGAESVRSVLFYVG